MVILIYEVFCSDQLLVTISSKITSYIKLQKKLFAKVDLSLYMYNKYICNDMKRSPVQRKLPSGLWQMHTYEVFITLATKCPQPIDNNQP